MNNYFDEWKAIAARIEALESSLGNFLKIAETILMHPIWRNASTDKHGIFAKFIVTEFQDIMDAIKAWNSKYPLLPLDIKQSIENFTGAIYERKTLEILVRSHSSSENFLVGCQAISPIFSLKAKVNYLLNDSEFKIRHLTELAFLHLKRSILVDLDIRAKWKEKHRETDLEQLGALHLLSHGIWAFKVNGERSRTDLACQEPLDFYLNDINRAASGLVLTEWKVVGNNQLESKAKVARKQLKLYSNGVFSGIELRNTRYVVLVAEKESNSILDVVEDGICYRHIIIATNPDTPSTQAMQNSTVKNRVLKSK